MIRPRISQVETHNKSFFVRNKRQLSFTAAIYNIHYIPICIAITYIAADSCKEASDISTAVLWFISELSTNIQNIINQTRNCFVENWKRIKFLDMTCIQYHTISRRRGRNAVIDNYYSDMFNINYGNNLLREYFQKKSVIAIFDRNLMMWVYNLSFSTKHSFYKILRYFFWRIFFVYTLYL